MIGEPRLFGADQNTVADPPAALTDTEETASGRPAGTTAADNTEAEEEPETFEALTLNRYDVPFTKPVTVHVVDEIVEQVAPSGNEVTVYPPITAPPSLLGTVQETTDRPSAPVVAITSVGAEATDEGVIATDAADAPLVPAAFVAVTVNVYLMPLVRPVTVQDNARVEMHTNPPGEDVTV